MMLIAGSFFVAALAILLALCIYWVVKFVVSLWTGA